MKIIVKCFILSMLAIVNSYGFDTTDEIKVLNKEYNQYPHYPIIIFNKSVIRELLTDSQDKNIQIIKEYLLSEFKITIDDNEADNILTYHTILNSSASALPFVKKNEDSYKFCAVFPSGVNTDHEGEVKRTLGITDLVNPYPEGTIERVMKLLSLEELKLISLYHELSHCLDKKFVPQTYASAAHHIHKAESFAEVLAMVLVTKKFNFRNLALRRSILRGLYTKYMGEHIINDQDSVRMHPNANEMGVVYYLSGPLIGINKIISSYNFMRTDYSIDQLNSLALDATETYALDSRTFSAVVNLLQFGKASALETYLEYSKSAPDLFYLTYLNLRKEALFLEDLDFLLEAF